MLIHFHANMKKNALLVLLLTVLTVAGLSFSHTQRAAATMFDDSPDDADGFASGDPCGYVEGTSTVYRSKHVDADAIGDNDQACADASGYFYSNDYPALSLYSDRNSVVNVVYETSGASGATYTYEVSLVGTGYGTVVDQTTGEWSGYGYITDDSYSGTNPWVWFDWACVGTDSFSGSDTTCNGAIDDRSYRVTTDLDTGVIQGYGWNDDLGFISFRNLTMELAPHDIQVWVDIYANTTELGPDDVDLDTGVLADGYDYWRVRVQFWDDTALEFLDESDFTTGTLSLDPATIGEVFLNQVENDGSATLVSAYNLAADCTDSAATYCSMTEADGSWSANTFVFAGAPTSDRTGMNTDTDVSLENSTDREGCRWIYHDQWYEVDGVTVQKRCPYPSGSMYYKEDVFYARTDSRNMIGLQDLTMEFTFASDRNMSVSTDDGTIEEVSVIGGGTQYVYTPTYTGDYDEDGIDDGVFLPFNPRFTTTKFVAVYDGEEYTQFASDQSTAMQLSTIAVLRNTSEAAQNQGFSVALKPEIDVYYQLDADSTSQDVSVNDKFFIVDTSDTGTVADCGRRTDTLSAGTYGDYYYSGVTPYSYAVKAPYTIGYGQKNAACQGFTPTTTTMANTVSDPTAEQWVCDWVSELRFNTASCYYTAYLNIVDRHDNPSDHPMTVLGAITSGLNDSMVLTNTDDISVFGNSETDKARNVIYGQVIRNMLGQTASTSMETLDSSMDPSSGLVELMNGRLVIAEGDVTVEGSSACSDKTLVTIGGNVYINGNITNCRLGVIALRVNDVGGNVDVAPDVTELYANFFLDGAFYSYNGSTTYADEPSWTNDETRVRTLLNQLYLNGSLVSRNTVNGADNTDGDGIYDVGDGTTTTNYAIAREHDLNMIRQYRLCYPLDTATGLPDTSLDPVACREGEDLSEYGTDNVLYNSFIIDYAPADSLPIFRSQN